MNKRLMLVAALTTALCVPVMAHEGEEHANEPTTEHKDQGADHKKHEHKAHEHKAGEHKAGEHADGAKGAKSKKGIKKGKKAKVEDPKSEMPAGMPMK